MTPPASASLATTPDGHPFADLALARRMERAEGAANAASVMAHRAIAPESGATWIEVAGTSCMFDGPQSPLTQTFGLGIQEPIGSAELDRIEAFFRGRGAAVHHEVSPFIDETLLAMLNERGYRAVELSNVLVRAIGDVPAMPTGTIDVRRVDPAEADGWAEIAAAGWSSESPELAGVVRELGGMIARAEGSHCFLAVEEGRPVAAASLFLHDDVALLSGASTIAEFRRRGAQAVLLAGRLRFAAERGARLAMVAAPPGSGSQRNAERRGFRVAYTRTKWRLS